MINTYRKGLSNLFERDIISLINELHAYEREEDLWKTKDHIKNSAGNLALHVAGNLRHFVGNILNDSGYKRDRESEFKSKNISRDVLIDQLEVACTEVKDCFENLPEDRFKDPYPIDVLGYETTIAHFIMHLYGHLNYHLGQINYHRRLI